MAEVLTVLHEIVNNFKKHPSKTAFFWLDKNSELVSSISYKELDLVTYDIATELLKVTCEGNYSSRTVVLCYTPGPEFISAFLGCLRAGLIPVPVKSPGSTDLYYKRSLQAVVKACGASFVLSNKHLFKGQDEGKVTTLTRLMEATGLEWFAVSDTAVTSNVIPEEEEGEEDQEGELQRKDQEPAVELDQAKTDDVAFLQFTTTEKPKGVMVTYKNLQHNFKLMDSCYGTSCHTTELCLLPHYNGFALVGSYLHILHTGASAFFISPQDFYQRPASWMEATSKFRISHAKIPSCAFIESIYVYVKDIDLSSLECISCLEPILPEDITTFEQCMVQNFNLKKNIVSVSYGLAEHVALICSSNIHNRDSRVAIKNRSSCGKPASDVMVKIVHPTEGFEMIEGDVGEIWVSSPSKAVGYYTDRKSTKETFHARLHNKKDKNQYLRTADLGFMANGELFIVETMSEVLNLEGRTVYPIDIESSIESILPSLSHCKSIVSNNPIHPDNQLLFIAELRSPSYNKRSYDNFRREVLTHIYHDFKLSVGTVVFFSPFSIPCTTFGKRQRALSYKLCLTTDAQIYKWTKPKGSEDMPMPTVLMPGKVNLSPVREDEQLSPTPPQTDLIPRPSTDSQSASPIHEGRLSPLPDEKSPSSARTRRVSAPAMPLSQTLPKVPLPRLKRAKSGDFMGRSGITLILHIAAKTIGHTVSPNDLIWEEGSPLVEEMSVMLKEKCGFNIDYGTMLLAQSPEALLAVMKMSLLSSEQVIKRHKPFRLSFSTTPPPIFESMGTSYHSNDDIAIVGVGGIFADCNNVEELWKLMAHNDSAITTRQGSSGGKKYTGCFSRILTRLDNTQYGLQDSEIASLDPHQMMLLHCTRECIKSAGFVVDHKQKHPADWGVFAGVSPSSSRAANCISHAFNLTGPMMALNCERTSLSPLSVACHHIQLKQCSAAIVCGARAILSPSDFPTAPDAMFPPGEGCAAVLLMSVGLARKFNRRILAVVKGTASNCDNPSSQRSQTGLLKRAFREAGLTAKDISFVEADLRGTKQEGTAHLDSIQNAFLPQGEEEEGVNGAGTTAGSVKVNIGDLGAASGVAALLRTVMVLEHALLPGSASWDVPNPTTPHSEVKAFPKEETDFSSKGKLLAGVVTSFGVTGCNEAAVIQEYSILPHMSGVSSWLILGADHMIGDRFWLLSEAARKSSCYAEIFGSLKTQFPLIQNALVHFNQVFQLACDKYRFKPHQKIAATFNVAVLKLYYGIFTQLSASGIKFSVLGGTNATNEVAALLFAGSIDLSTAILFMCCKSLLRGRERSMHFSISDHPDDQAHQDPVSLPHSSQDHVKKSESTSKDPEKKLSRSEEALVQKLTNPSQEPELKLSRSDEDLVQKLVNPVPEPKKLSHSDEEVAQKVLKKSTPSGQGPLGAQKPGHLKPVLKQKLLEMKHFTENPEQQHSSKHSSPVEVHDSTVKKDSKKQPHHGKESMHNPIKPDRDPGKKPAHHQAEHSSQKPNRNHSKKQALPGGQKHRHSSEGSVQKPSQPGQDTVKNHSHLGEDHTQKDAAQTSKQQGRNHSKKHTNITDSQELGHRPTQPSQDHASPPSTQKAAGERDSDGKKKSASQELPQKPTLSGQDPGKKHGNPGEGPTSAQQGEGSSKKPDQASAEDPTQSGQQDKLVREDLDDAYENLTQSSKQSSKGSETSIVKGPSVNPSMLVKLISKPKTLVFSCIESKILSPSMFTDKAALTRYVMDLVENVGKPGNPRIYLDFLVAKRDREPLLYVTSDEDIMATKESVFAISFKHLQDTNSSRYLREAYLNLRRFSDRAKVKKNAPLLRNDIASNGLYERYPFRKIVEGLEKPKKLFTGKKREST